MKEHEGICATSETDFLAFHITHTQLSLTCFNVLMFPPSGFKHTSLFPKGISLKEA